MTPEETKAQVERRLSERGWSAHIGRAGYEKISRFTGGDDGGIHQLCNKLISLGALQERREITEDVVEMAILDMSRMGETLQQAAGGGEDIGQIDLPSIEKLAAVLDAKVANGELEPRGSVSAPRKSAAKTGAPGPKILVVDATKEMRARYFGVLSKNFTLVEAQNGEQAWQLLLDQPDVELVITDLDIPTVDGFGLIRRIREAVSPPHLVGLPIIVVTGPDNADAKLRVLKSGANDFITRDTDPLELRGRVLARHRASKVNPAVTRPARPASRSAALGADRNGNGHKAARPSDQHAPAAPRRPDATHTARMGPVGAITTERRYAAHGAVPGHRAAPPTGSFAARLYRVSSTTTITVTATVLLALAIGAIFLISQSGTTFRTQVSERLAATKPSVVPPDARREAPPATGGERDLAPAVNEETRDPDLPKAPVEEPPPSAAAAGSAGRSLAEEPRTSDPPGEALNRAESGANRDQSARSDTSAAEPTTPKPSESERAASASRETPKPERESAKSEREVARAESTTKEQDKTQEALTAPQKSPPSEPEQQTARAAPTPPAAAATGSADETRPANGSAEIAAAAPQPEVLPETPPSPPPNRISQAELQTFLTRFASVYEAGDLEQFMGLFADHARTNDRTSRQGIRVDYESLFRTTDVRQMNLGEINWELRGREAHGWGEFDVRVRRRGEQSPYIYTGSLTFVLEKADGRLRIARLYHGQRRADNR